MDNKLPEGVPMPIVKQHDTCPIPDCGGKPFVGGLAARMQLRGLLGSGVFGLSTLQNVIGDQNTMSKAKMGERIPAYKVELDVCDKCGCLFGVWVEEASAVKKPNIHKVPPGSGPLDLKKYLPGQNRKN